MPSSILFLLFPIIHHFLNAAPLDKNANEFDEIRKNLNESTNEIDKFLVKISKEISNEFEGIGELKKNEFEKIMQNLEQFNQKFNEMVKMEGKSKFVEKIGEMVKKVKRIMELGKPIKREELDGLKAQFEQFDLGRIGLLEKREKLLKEIEAEEKRLTYPGADIQMVEFYKRIINQINKLTIVENAALINLYKAIKFMEKSGNVEK